MAPFSDKETGKIIPYGRTVFPGREVSLEHSPDDDNHALIIFEGNEVDTYSKDGHHDHVSLAHVNIIGEEGKDYVIKAGPVNSYTLTWEPSARAKAERVVTRKKDVKYYPVSTRMLDFGYKIDEKYTSSGKWIALYAIAVPAILVKYSEKVAAFPFKVYDNLTHKWDKEAKLLEQQFEAERNK